MIRKTLRVHLGKRGYEVQEAVDGMEAMEKLRDDNFDLLVCDILMSKKDGWEALKEVRSNPKMKDMPIIILTAKNEDKSMFKGYDLGANDYLTKPFTKVQLLYRVKLMFGETQG